MRRILVNIALLFAAPLAFAACPSSSTIMLGANAPTATYVSLASAGITTCYYASQSTGNDSNAGTSEGSPWKHLPGMSGCSSTCAGVTPTGGDGFIMRGGDTWTVSGGDFTSLQLTYSGGSSGAPMYWGVDPNWYAGSSWSRPIFNCNNTQCDSNLGSGDGANGYITLDNIEITGFEMTSTSGNPPVIEADGAYSGATNVYIHNFTTTNNITHSNALFSQTAGNGAIGSFWVQNVVDGSDSEQNFMAGIVHGSTVAYNVLRYVYNGFNGTTNNFFGNFVEHNYASGDGDHCNMVFTQGPFSGSSMLIYGNVIQHTTCAGSVTLWLGGLSCSAYNGYAFNNAVWDTQNGNVINPPDTVGGCSTLRTWNFFNNTVECGPDSGPGATCFSDSGDVGNPNNGIMNFNNDQWITSGTAFSCAVLTCNTTTSITQSLGTANGQGYSSGSTYAFQPTSGSGGTVGAGTNEASLCSTISGINSLAGSACANDTAYAVTYNVATHTAVPPGRSVLSRPGGAWDIAAYQWSGSSTLAPPSFSPGGGTFLALPSVTITHPAGSTACYTTDGSTPAASTPGTCSHGTTYSSPVTIPSSGTVLQAIATESGFLNSSVTSATYNQTPIIKYADVGANGGSSSLESLSCPAISVPAGGGITAEIAYAPQTGISVIVSDNVNAGAYRAAVTTYPIGSPYPGAQTAIYFYPGAPSAVSTTVSMVLSGPGTYLGISCQSWQPSVTGLQLTQDLTFTQQQTVASTANPTTGSNKTPANANSLVIGNLLTNSLSPSAAGSGYAFMTTESGQQLFPEYQVQSSASGTNAPFVMSSDSWTDQMVDFFFSAPSAPGSAAALTATSN